MLSRLKGQPVPPDGYSGIRWVAHRRWCLNDYEITYSHRSPSSPMGRFGGGFQWEVGVQVARRMVIINLLVSALVIQRRRHLTRKTSRTSYTKEIYKSEYRYRAQDRLKRQH